VKDVELSKEKYEVALSDITKYNAEYMENMTEARDSACLLPWTWLLPKLLYLSAASMAVG